MPIRSTTYVDKLMSFAIRGTPFLTFPVPQVKPKSPRYDRLALALYYQSLLNSGEVENRAQLARHVGVSRARVTQVLKRLQD